LAPGTFGGIVALNGGLPMGLAPGDEPALPFFGVVGETDFNYYEMRDVERRLTGVGVPNRLEIFPGSHEWPPPEVVERGVGWLELRAMREGLRPPDPALVELLWQEELARARGHDQAGDLLAAARAWRAMAETFAGLRDVAEAKGRVAALEALPAWQEAQRADARRLERDRTYLERAPDLLHAAWGEAPDVGELLAALDIPGLQHRAKKDPDPEERLSAERVLYAVYIQSALYLPRTFSESGEHQRALFYLRVAAAIEPEIPHVPYRQAATWAQLGNRREALAALERAVELGWEYADDTAADPAFAAYRNDERFQALLERMRRPKPAGRRRRGLTRRRGAATSWAR
jgi:tetratricopeptide (TPR) repeat protein